MKKIVIVYLLTILISVPATSSTICEQSDLLIENVKLFGEKNLAHILISEGRISKIGHGAIFDNKKYDGSRRLDAAGAYALPGLIDSHTHFDSLPASKNLQETLDIQTEIFPITMRQTLASGVTTARVHLAAFEDMSLMKLLSDDVCFPTPRLVMSGPGLLAGAPAVNSRLMKGYKNSSELKSAIQQRLNQGAEWVALHQPAQFTADDVSVLQRMADTGKLKFMADTDSFENFTSSLKLPISSAEYINRSPTTLYPEGAIKGLKEKREPFYISAPVGYYARSAKFSLNTQQKLDQSLFRLMPAGVAEEMKRSFAADFKEDNYIDKAVQSYDTMPGKFQQLRDAGALFVVGSDSGSLGQFHHDAVWHELATLHEFGLTAKEAIDSATIAPAQMLKNNDIGQMTQGSYGDIVLYIGDLNAGEFSRANVSAVIKGGTIFVKNGSWVGPSTSETQAMIQRHISKLDALQK
jgi:imidazolonepropionase-like amidohydrolase